MTDFFVLRDPLGTRAFRARFEDEIDPYALLRRDYEPEHPLKMAHASGSDLFEIVWTTSVVPIIVSSDAINVLESNGISGWETYPVVLHDRQGKKVEDYVGLTITGRCGSLDEARSAREWSVMPGGRYRVLRGLFFDPETWDGSDLFVSSTPGSGSVFASDRVNKVLRDKRVRNLKMVPQEAIERQVV
jgi:hypothetical protein